MKGSTKQHTKYTTLALVVSVKNIVSYYKHMADIKVVGRGQFGPQLLGFMTGTTNHCPGHCGFREEVFFFMLLQL